MNAKYLSAAIIFQCGFIIFIRGFAIKSTTCKNRLRREVNPCLTEECLPCVTEECLRSASFIRNTMNLNVNPCDDFYEFVCGNHTTMGNEFGIDSFNEIKEITLMQLKTILEMNITNDDNRPLRMAQEFYFSCLRNDMPNNDGMYTIYTKIKQISEWPLNQISNLGNDTDWIKIIEQSRELGFSSNFINPIFVINYPQNSSIRLLAFRPPTVALPAEILQFGLANPVVKNYYEFMLLVAIKFKTFSTVFASTPLLPFTVELEEIQEILQFEINLARVSLLIPDLRAGFSGAFGADTISTIQKNYPSVDWLKYVRAVIGPRVLITKSENVGVIAPEAMQKLDTLLANTPNRVITDYLLWRYIFFSLKITFAVSEPKWQNCISLVNPGFGAVLQSKYIQNYFSEDRKEKVLEMVKRLKREIHNSLLDSEWIDEDTRFNALEKLDEVIEFVGYPSYIFDEEKNIVHLYRNLHIDPDNYYDSALNISKFLLDTEFVDLRMPINRTLWPASFGVTKANAFYLATQNAIVIPAAMLQNIFYSADRPNYLNYGTIGFVIGHELLHAFDAFGSYIDKQGNFMDWWLPQTREMYSEKADCYVQQYNSYVAKETRQNVNGKLTLGENLADNEGIRKAYYAYKSWAAEHGVEKPLPGLDYSPEQLFWIGSAKIWCAAYDPSTLRYLVENDYHSPAMVRVNGKVSNQKEFAEDFACPAGSNMNPLTKCSLW